MAAMFTCAACGGTFPKAWTDDEALAESRALFGEQPRDSLVQVCDDCFELMMKTVTN